MRFTDEVSHSDQSLDPHASSASNDYDGPEASRASSADLHVRSDDDDDIARQHAFPIPVWLRESSKSFRWRWMPLPIRSSVRALIAWSQGPKPPQIQRITPWFPAVQEAPLRLVDYWCPKRWHKAMLLATAHLVWLLVFTLVLQRQARSGTMEGYGVPASLWCGASFWSGRNECGLNGNDCRPFENAVMAFKCPANCASVKVLNPYAVGDQEINYANLVIGGPSGGADDQEPRYRADSFICEAAIHAGVVSNTAGGCGVASLMGAWSDFPASSRNGISSIGFAGYFPKSFTFLSFSTTDCGAVDLRWPLLAVTATLTAIISLTTTSPAIFFASIFATIFTHVGLVSDKPNISDYPALLSVLAGRFLPAAFVAVVLYRYCVRPQLADLTAQMEKTILWLGGAWIGALSNYTFDFIPIQRLTPHDLQAQPGAYLALIVIVLLVLAIAGGQIHYLRLEGRLRRYLVIYAIMASGLLATLAIPFLSLRIHHYILALLLLPGTALQTRPSLLWQGLLLGLFINGIARWDFDPILQTPASLSGGAPSFSPLPNITAPLLGAANITFAWAWPSDGYDGVSTLVNDVERHRWYIGEGSPQWTWQRRDKGPGDTGVDEYFRFAYMSGANTADYTRAGRWNGSFWWAMEEGPS